MEYTDQQLHRLSDQLAGESVEMILEWTFDTFGKDVAMTTSFGYSGLVLLHQALQLYPNLPLYFIDTGFHFEETLQFSEQLQEKWNLNLHIVKPEISQKELKRRLGDKPYENNPDLCCNYNKVEPLLKVINDKSAWLSGIRRDQSSSRANIEIVERDRWGTIKVSPLYDWTREQAWEYIRAHDIPYHPLHDEDYFSIGCEPCTAPVNGNGQERDGRWPSSGKMECGLHQSAGMTKQTN